MNNEWGPPVWESIHRIAMGYPADPKQSHRHTYAMFFKYLGEVLPCSACSSHYAKHLEELRIDDYLDSPDKLFEWTVKLHNAVNVDIGKGEMSVAQARALYASSGGGSPWTTPTVAVVVAGVLCAVIAVVFAMRMM
jgi:hypothetical protein